MAGPALSASDAVLLLQVENGVSSRTMATAMVAGPAPSPNAVRAGPLLQSHSQAFNNIGVILVALCVICLPLVGLYLDRCWPKPFKNRPHTWRGVLLLIAAYVVWVPAIFSKDFSFNIGFIVPLVGNRIGITMDEHNSFAPGPIHESTRSLIKLLLNKDCWLGAVLLSIYAFAVPVLKLILLTMGEHFRNRPDQADKRHSRRCLLLMQAISKWAAPDMFGYILLYCLVRNLQKLPVDSVCVFDMGFTCYSTFILVSSMAAMTLPLPADPDEQEGMAPRANLVARMLGHRGVSLAMLCNLAAWVPLFALGIMTPCFSLRLDSATLKDNVPPAMKTVLGAIKLEDMVPPQGVSLTMAIQDHLGWFQSDIDLNLLLCFVMLLVFGVIFTAVHMLTLVIVAFQTRFSERGAPIPSMWKFSESIKHLAMLDVFVMGVLVCTLSAGSFSDQGLILEIMTTGFVSIVVSEVIRLISGYLVQSVVDYHFMPPTEECSAEGHRSRTSELTRPKS
mmetsp:Transcript_38386/g.86508  ORF Transcript_38386/g.86508 Transcript_38386/m.86508 type:complete len:505 (+) Transcript_38386:52-1566(+)|eukprot:CAMPEP_0197906306 /NCGR_PEP_ID=MMETSP1439-20131203/62305_1 /TAXON_ID=66791 /ORGANISM="Gonyaulax spinifera, Strain CCMP409" /LENGTH=504 /DNA_ID=CAMNT_0043527647 /DNA_START=52 /DNA_END=1566 /DNA_ORIENTATION=-